MTRAYDDIEAVTRLLEEKEKDLELTVQIGKELLTQNTVLEKRVTDLEAELRSANDDRQQLLHDLQKKNDLIAVLTNDTDEGGSEKTTPTFSKSITVDLLQKKISTLQEENKSLKMDVHQLACQTDEVEEQERKIMSEITGQLMETNSQMDGLSLELERQREENRLLQDQVVNLTARLSETEMRLHQVSTDNDEHVTLLNITKENQNCLALELLEFKQRYQEVLTLLQEANEQLRKQRKRVQPQARNSFITSSHLLAADSLKSELMESSMLSENSLDSGISADHAQMNDSIGQLMSSLHAGQGAGTSSKTSSIIGAAAYGPPSAHKKVFETVRCASRNGSFSDGSSSHLSMSQIGAITMSSSSMPRMSPMPFMGGNMSTPATSNAMQAHAYGMSDKRSYSPESCLSQTDEEYLPQATGIPGAPGAKDLENALKRLTPGEVLARRAMLSYAPAGTYNYEENSANTAAQGFRTPDSVLSGSSSGLSSTMNMLSSVNQWRLPEKLQIVKPLEGSLTLNHWTRLATPTLSGLLEDRPGVAIRGGCDLLELGIQTYTLSDIEEDVPDDLPGKQYETRGSIYTYTNSMVMHPDDGVCDLSFLSQSQVSSRMASASTSRQPSCPPTPRTGRSRRNSCSTYSVNMGLASMLNERGIKAVTPSAINTPAGANFSPTVTPCNSPEGSPTRAFSPEPLFGIFSSGADMIRRRLTGSNMTRERERLSRSQQKKQKIQLSHLERRALKSLRLVEKVESIGLENIISTQPSAISQLASGIASRSVGSGAQFSSFQQQAKKSDEMHFDRAQIKGVLNKAFASSSSGNSKADLAHEDDPLAGYYINDDNLDINAAQMAPTSSTAPVSQAAAQTAAAANITSNQRAKQMQRQKSRRNLRNGDAAQQRPDLGTIVRPDAANNAAAVKTAAENIKKAEAAAAAAESEERTKSLTETFAGTVSSLLFGRKGGWL